MSQRPVDSVRRTEPLRHPDVYVRNGFHLCYGFDAALFTRLGGTYIRVHPDGDGGLAVTVEGSNRSARYVLNLPGVGEAGPQ
jgi:hypothetical protein